MKDIPDGYHEEVGNKLKKWILIEGNLNVIEFAVSASLSKNELFKLAGENQQLQKDLDFAITVMEWKITEGALYSKLDRTTSLRMLETYCDWKSEVNILQKNEYKQYMNEAQHRANLILEKDKEVLPDNITVDALTAE